MTAANIQSRPTVPTVVDSKGQPSSQARIPFQRVTVSEAHITRPDGHVDAAQLSRILGLIQDNSESSTEAVRSDPTLKKTIRQSIAMTSGKMVTITHMLGCAFSGYRCTRAYAGSAPFAAVEAANNGGQDPTKVLVLTSSATGTYDVEIFGG
jgi:hypothetical protein